MKGRRLAQHPSAEAATQAALVSASVRQGIQLPRILERSSTAMPRPQAKKRHASIAPIPELGQPKLNDFLTTTFVMQALYESMRIAPRHGHVPEAAFGGLTSCKPILSKKAAEEINSCKADANIGRSEEKRCPSKRGKPRFTAQQFTSQLCSSYPKAEELQERPSEALPCR